MNQFTWLASGLKSLRLCTNAVLGNAGQTRLASGQSQADHPKPKKPLTPYFRFMQLVRPEIMKSNPQLKAIEISRLVGEKWSKLDDSAKKKYGDAFKSEMTSYNTIIEKYYQSLTQEERDSLQKEKIDRQLRKEKREHRQRVRDLGRPKKPPTAFLQYLMSKIKPGGGLEEYRELAKVEGGKWKNLSESEKLPYLNKYKSDSEKYKKELLKWEGQMLKDGNDDLVRVKQLAQSSRKSK